MVRPVSEQDAESCGAVTRKCTRSDGGCKTNSFTGETPVLMCDGSTNAISEVDVPHVST